MTPSPPTDRKRVRFAAPRDRRGWRLRFLAAALLAGASLALAADAASRGAGLSALVATAGGLGFSVLAVSAFRRSLSHEPPLVIDDRGLAVDDGLGLSWHLSWQDIRGVRLRRGLLRRRVVIELREGSLGREIPAACHAGLPPEWLAGLIDTFRERGGRLGASPPAD